MRDAEIADHALCRHDTHEGNSLVERLDRASSCRGGSYILLRVRDGLLDAGQDHLQDSSPVARWRDGPERILVEHALIDGGLDRGVDDRVRGRDAEVAGLDQLEVLGDQLAEAGLIVAGEGGHESCCRS